MSDSAQDKMAHALQEQQAQWGSFVSKALESSTKLVELNLKMTRQSLDDATLSVRHLLAAKSPEDIFSVDQGAMQERLNQALLYANEIGAITTAFTGELSQALQANWTDSYQKISKLSDSAPNPAGAKNIFPAMGSAQQGYEQWMDAGKKLIESFGQNLAMPVSVPVAAKKAPSKAAPAAKSRTRH